MDPLVAVLIIFVLIAIRFMIPAVAMFTFAKLVDRYFPAQ